MEFIYIVPTGTHAIYRAISLTGESIYCVARFIGKTDEDRKEVTMWYYDDFTTLDGCLLKLRKMNLISTDEMKLQAEILPDKKTGS